MVAVAAVLVDCPGIEDLYSYQIPEDIPVQVGDIVTVPLNKRIVSAIVMEITNARDHDQEFYRSLRVIHSCISTSVLSGEYWQLLQKTAHYYRTPLLQTVRIALPPGLVDQSQERLKVVQSSYKGNLSPAAHLVWQFLAPHGKKGLTRRFVIQKIPDRAHAGLRELQKLGLVVAFLEPPRPIQPCLEDRITLLHIPDQDITTRQKEILIILQRLGGDVRRSVLRKEAETSYTTIASLAKKGYVVIHSQEVLRFGSIPGQEADQVKKLTNDQYTALSQILALLGTPQEILLHGVTGSGKTEVYLQAIAVVLAQKKSALVLVPEIGLTPQLTDRFCARFGNDQVLIYHSHLSDGERFDTWRYVLSGEPRVIVGTRSAVFLPLAPLGIIILDEEHDSSFKQDQPQPCYHARTIAQWRMSIASCPLVLGSATPAAESFFAAQNHQITYLMLPHRVGGQPLPAVTIVDMRMEFLAGNRSLFSRTLQTAVATMLTQGKQGILFVPRRGYSTFVSCRSCGYVLLCNHCDVSLSYHLPHSEIASDRSGQLICHYCNYRQVQPPTCPQCGSKAFRYFGSGTQRVLEELQKLFPELKIQRFDSDTTRNKNQHRQILSDFQEGKADILIGTQMITKGIDIPQVTLVGVMAADGLLHFSDFRAGERAFQLLVQVAGRAGRGSDPGTVIVQTYAAEHAVITAVQQYAYEDFIRTELAEREAFGYPPIGKLILIHLSSGQEDRVTTTATDLANYLRHRDDQWQVLGPAPAGIYKVSNRYRWQILVKFAPDRFPQFPQLSELRQQIKDKNVRVTIDVDPVNIL